MYILLSFIIAGLNYAVAPEADTHTAVLISNIWHFYENEFKTLLILICSALSIKLISKRERSRMRIRNYTGFIISALVVHIVGPMLTGTREMYFVSMPLPWSSLSIQLFDTSTGFHQSFTSHWGYRGALADCWYLLSDTIFLYFSGLCCSAGDCNALRYAFSTALCPRFSLMHSR